MTNATMNSNPLARDLDEVLERTEQLWEAARGARFFITGGTGFVGTWLTESLVWANRRLNLGIAAAIVTRDAARFEARLPHLVHNPAVRLIVSDASAIRFPKLRADFIVHAAASKPMPANAEDPTAEFDHEIAAVRHVLEVAGHNKGCRFLFTSSGAVYGKQPPALRSIPESFAGAPQTVDANSTRAQAKRVSEFLCASYARARGFESVIARMFTFIGPHLPLDEDYAAGNFLREALAGGPIRLAGDGTSTYSYLYAADLAAWLWTILFRGQSGGVYNVGSPEAISTYDLACAIARIAGGGIRIEIAQPLRPGQPAARYVPCVRRAEEELGLRVWTSLEEAIRRMPASAAVDARSKEQRARSKNGSVSRPSAGSARMAAADASSAL